MPVSRLFAAYVYIMLEIFCLCPVAEAMKNLVNLQVLDLRHNKFKEVPTVVYELQTLKTLYLRFNKIRAVSASIGKLEVRGLLGVWEECIFFDSEQGVGLGMSTYR